MISGSPKVVVFPRRKHGLHLATIKPDFVYGARVMKRGLINIAIGIVLIIVGAVVTFGTYAMVSQKGGHYYIAWGAAVIGAWRVILGVYQIVRASFTAEGRASLRSALWPSNSVGRIARLGLVVLAGGAGWLFAPEAWTSFSPSSLHKLQEADSVRSVAFSPDRKWIALGLGYGGLKIVNASTGEAGKAPALGPYTDIEAVAFSPDGRLLAAATSRGLRIWSNEDWDRGEPTLVSPASEPANQSMPAIGRHAVAFSPDGTRVATGSVSQGTFVFDARSGALKWQTNTKESVSAVAFSRDGRLVASAGQDYGDIKLWDAMNGTDVRTLHAQGSWQPTTTLAFFHDGRLAAGSYQKPGITIWDSRTGTQLQTLSGTSSMLGAPGNVWSIAISPDDTWIASGNSDRSIRFWNAKNDLKDEKPARSIFGHANDVMAVAFSPDGDQFVSGGADKVLNIWAKLP
jgi:WD40 repeat protein